MTGYITATEYREYCDLYGYDYSGLDDTRIEQYSLRATRYIEAIYTPFWPGSRNAGNAWSWPRTGATYQDGEEIPADIVPDEVKNATAEAVLLITGSVNLTPTIEAGGIPTLEKTRIEGAVETEKRFSVMGSQRATYTSIEDALSRIIYNPHHLTLIRAGGAA